MDSTTPGSQPATVTQLVPASMIEDARRAYLTYSEVLAPGSAPLGIGDLDMVYRALSVAAHHWLERAGALERLRSDLQRHREDDSI